MPENFCKLEELPKIFPKQLAITHSKKKDNVFFQIEDKNQIQPEYYEGIKEECSQKSSGYLALVQRNNEIRVLPVTHWILFHKNLKYMDEDEYNSKVKKAEEEILKIQKGKRARKILMKRKEEEDEEEELKKDFEKKEKKEESSEEESERQRGGVLGKRKRLEDGGLSDRESIRALEEEEKDENEFFDFFTQNKTLPQTQPAQKIQKKEIEISLFNMNPATINNNTANTNNNEIQRPKSKYEDSELGSRSVTSDIKKDDTFDDDFPELKN